MRPVLLLPLSALLGCPAAEDISEHLCSHVGTGGSAVVASSVPDDATPAIEVSEHGIWEVDLEDAMASYVRFEVEEHTAAVLALGEAALVSGFLHDGEDASFASGGAMDCSSGDPIPEHYELDLEPGTWHIAFAASAGEPLWLMLVPTGAEHAD